MNGGPYSEHFKVARQAIEAAEKIFLQYFRKPFTVETKDDNSPVTIADKTIEKVMKEIINKSFPSHSFIGEESGITDLKSEFTWIMDGIDGTHNFIHGIPLCGTLLALMHNGKIVLGISNMPKINMYGYAIQNQGAYINDERVYVSNKTDIDIASITFGGLHYFAKQKKLNQLMNQINISERSRAVGDLISYMTVALAQYDILLSYRAMIWDMAPGVIMIEEAGGKVTDVLGNPITVHSTNVLATNGKLHDAFLALI